MRIKSKCENKSLNIINKKSVLLKKRRTLSSGWQDSNLRPPGPKPGTLTGLCYIPNFAESMGFEPMHRFPDDGLANRSINHSGNSP